MSDKLKNTIQWSMYFAIMAVLLITIFIPIVVNMLAPTWFPCADISGFNNISNISGSLLSFFSVCLAVFSIWQAKTSSTQMNRVLNKLTVIQNQQEAIKSAVNQNYYNYGTMPNEEMNTWQIDRNNE